MHHHHVTRRPGGIVFFALAGLGAATAWSSAMDPVSADTSGPAALRTATDAPASDSAVLAPDADRAAILAMAGAFEVTFRFEETVGFDAAYELEAPYLEDALELVTVIDDTGDFISLQHVLVVERPGGDPIIVKHWRQDWRYEDRDVLQFAGDRTWSRDLRSADTVRGTWTQSVFQTTDAPRYESVGTWTHRGGASSWESETTWRPLPRRERNRTDYDVIVCTNRHTVTATGWVHEQDNQKVVLDAAGAACDVIAHELGLNTYRRVDIDRVQVAVDYWTDHADAWAEIRAAWDTILAQPTFTLRTRARNGARLDAVVDEALDSQERRDALADDLTLFLTRATN